MTVSSAELAALIREIEAEDPIDYADLPYAEDDLRLLVCSQIREMAEEAGRLSEENRQTVLLAVAAKLVVENLVLHIRLLKAQGSALDESAEALFRRLRERPR
jgi:hypothetical protein